MSYYHQEKNIEEYIQMAKGYNGQKLITELLKHLPQDSRVLEIGMGPGTDLTILGQHYKVTGSDYSEMFLNRCRKTYSNADLLVLDAVTLETDLKYQGIYSNKVLLHLTHEELKKSIKRQAEVLDPLGIICHSFWWGNKEEIYNGLRFIYYAENQLRTLFMDSFDIITIRKYQEIEPDDSLFIIARKR